MEKKEIIKSSLGPKKERLKDEEIIRKFTPLIKASIKKYFKNNDDFNDAFQDGVLRILELIKSYDSNSNCNFESYLKNYLKFFYMQKYFKQKQRLNHTFSNSYLIEDNEKNDAIFNIKDENVDIEKEILDCEMKENVRLSILSLPKRQKQVIYLKFFKSLKNKEIALRLAIKEDTVKEYYKIAKKKLKTNLKV